MSSSAAHGPVLIPRHALQGSRSRNPPPPTGRLPTTAKIPNSTKRLQCFTSRPLVFQDVEVRVSPQFSTVVHIDYDEANACGFQKGDRGVILK